MDPHPEGVKKNDQRLPIDPAQRVFVPIEKRRLDGSWVFKTMDGDQYFRDADGTIRRMQKKVNGKLAKRMRRRS